jgi:alpha-beta hydrolase superfamily lysophospholipase
MEANDVKVVGGQPGCRFDAASPILFVHGMWHAAWCWNEHFFGYFERRGLSAHALNLRGHGGRLSGPRSLRWTSLSDYVHDLCDAVSLFRNKPVLVGHSLGCLLVEICLERIRPPAAVLLAPTRHAIFRRSTVGFLQRHPWRCMELILRGSMRPVVATPTLGHEMLFAPSHPLDQVQLYCSRLQEESFRVATELLLGIGPRPTLSPSTRILVLGAGADRAVSRNAVESVAAAHGHQAEFFEGMGHDMMLDPNWEAVASRIVAWLGEQPSPTPPITTAPDTPTRWP